MLSDRDGGWSICHRIGERNTCVVVVRIIFPTRLCSIQESEKGKEKEIKDVGLCILHGPISFWR